MGSIRRFRWPTMRKPQQREASTDAAAEARPSQVEKVPGDANLKRGERCADAPRRRRSSALRRDASSRELARTDADTVNATTISHSLRLMGRRIGSSVKVGQLAEQLEAVVDFFACQLLQTFGAKALDRE